MTPRPTLHVGQRVGKLTVLGRYPAQCSHIMWKVRCDCGIEFVRRGNRLKTKSEIESCGCEPWENLAGDRFNRWLVTSYAGRKKHVSTWNCVCDCGTTRQVSGARLKSGETQSCGCLTGDTASTFWLKHGNTVGGEKSPEYRSWQAMIARCYNPKNIGFKHYGGRGITVSDLWRNDFRKFLSDVGPKPTLTHTLDRYPDFNGNYAPGNVRWATPTEQANNKALNVRVTIAGRTQTLTEWARERGLKYTTVRSRLHKGWSLDRAFEIGT